MLLFISYIYAIVFVKEFGPLMRCFYAAYIDNFVMSVLFVSLLFKRKSLAGQSLSIAVYKLFATLLISIGYYIYGSEIPNSYILRYFVVTILFFDALYVVLVYLQSKKDLFLTIEKTA
jgi:hypothetical protein